MGTIALIILAYLIGSLSFAVLVSRAFGLPDPRSYGSGNPGATNVMRSGKKAAAVLTLLGDGAKGWCAVFLAQQLAPGWGAGDPGIAAAALAVFIGHIYPVFFGFKGGKGVATAAGILFALNVWLGLAVAATWLLTFALSRYSSLSALVASALAPLYANFFLSKLYVGMAIVLSGLLIWRHRANIQKLLQGKEGSFKKAQE
ncbi:MAG: glycerol-3-phosphate acyltransferase [Betaproteobacteria bacterium RBG_16_58_11]|nr:MAG: glycerol-3-phosphate acyltransferase [Betaproteobacteria bacterium RBG_16_58_11]